MSDPKPGEVYRHFKTEGRYTILHIAIHVVSGDELVVYQDDYHRIWARPLATFFDAKQDAQDRTVPRFTKMEE